MSLDRKDATNGTTGQDRNPIADRPGRQRHQADGEEADDARPPRTAEESGKSGKSSIDDPTSRKKTTQRGWQSRPPAAARTRYSVGSAQPHLHAEANEPQGFFPDDGR